MAFSPDGKYLVAGDTSPAFALWHLDDKKLLSQVKLGPVHAHVSAIAITPDGKQAIVATLTAIIAPAPGNPAGQISIWNLPSCTLKKNLDVELGAFCIAVSSDSKQAFTTGEETLQLWDLSTATLKKEYREFRAGSGKPTFVAHNSQVLIDHRDGAFFLDLANGKIIKRLPKLEEWIYEYSAEATKAVAGQGDNVLLFDVAQGKLIRTLAAGIAVTDASGKRPLAITERYSVVTMSSDAQMIAASGSDPQTKGRITLWMLAKAAEPRQLATAANLGPLHAMTFSPDGKLLATADDSGTIQLWHIPSGKLTGTLSAPAPRPK